ncbi:MAG: hypothetical protein RLZZ387_3304 [Chloroflexota bacterium]
MKQLHVLLAQLPVPNNPATNAPLAAGYLKSYALHAESAATAAVRDRLQIDILPRALADHAGDAALVEAIVARRPDVLGLSLYTWNSERSLELARCAKQRLPELIVVGGGPEVQADNAWVLRHPGLDIGVVGEGEQTFAELLRLLVETPTTDDRRPTTDDQNERCSSFVPGVAHIPGLAYRDQHGEVVLTAARAALPELSVVPSPYLLGYLEIAPGALHMVEVSRWCPYACSFCLYGRNMGTKLGGRIFGLERILAEIRWGLERGATRVHFIEANLNLVPVFQPLMRALAELNADGRLALYAELRGEHLTEEAVASLVRAGLRVAEVGLQTANPVALRAAHRRTDLQKWAAGTRRLYAHGVEVLLDVILGLPEDDAGGVAQTLAFIQGERLGPYDAFTLQVLPGVAVRAQAARHSIVYQDRPPYYVLATDRFSFAELRRLRRKLKIGAGLDPDAVDGCPEPHLDALSRSAEARALSGERPGSSGEEANLITHVRLDSHADRDAALLAAHVDIVAPWELVQRSTFILQRYAEANPSTLVDLYVLCEDPPPPRELQQLRDSLPFQPGYLDRVAVYRRAQPEPPYERVSPRVFLVLPWTAQADPADYVGVAEIIWEYELAEGEEPPFGAWEAAGGAGVYVGGVSPKQVAAWRPRTHMRLWHP